MAFPNITNCTIGIIGLGYVGLPLAVEFSKATRCLRTDQKLKRKVIGFDINTRRVSELAQGIDKTGEVKSKDILNNPNIKFTTDYSDLINSDVFIVTVPTPIDSSKQPDLHAIKSACKIIGNTIKIRSTIKSSNPIIIFESTVYPGLTEEVCVKIIRENSGLNYNNERESSSFFCGYSPERINPGNKKHTLTEITKITSGSNISSSNWIDLLYGSIIKAGTYKTYSIKEAEAAKVIENTQRDLNIALINELAIIFSKMGLDTNRVLEAAETKWNFLSFKPGLVGGHCIGVDPYYLTYKSEQSGYKPDVVLAGRRINDNMATWIIDRLIMKMCKESITIGKAKLLILGFTFKENCRDIRNTQVITLYKRALEYSMNVDIFDPICDINEANEC